MINEQNNSNYYSMPEVNLDKLQDFYAQIESKNDCYAQLFKSAFPDKQTLAQEQTALKSDIEFTENMLAGNINSTLKGALEKLKDQYKHKLEENETLCKTGYSVRDIKTAVATILGIINTNNQDDFKLRSEYFDLLVQAKLLPFKKISLQQFSYKPGLVALDFFKSHSNIKKIAIGCGHKTEMSTSICGGLVRRGFHSEALNIDIGFHNDPDILVDMNNLEFWNEIPEGYLSEIHDHTNTDILYKNQKTIAAIHKALAGDGKLFLLAVPGEEEKMILEKNGFIPADINDPHYYKKTL